MNGVAEEVAKEAMRLAQHKLPIKTKFISKRSLAEEQSLEERRLAAEATENKEDSEVKA
jgi:ribosomal protein L16/L10AE